MKRVAFAHAVKISFMIRSAIEQPYMAFKFFNFFKKKEVKIRISIDLSSFFYHVTHLFSFPHVIYTDFYKTRPKVKCALGAIITKEDDCELAARDVGLTYNTSCTDCPINHLPFGCFYAPGNKYAWFNEQKDVPSTKPMSSVFGSLCETEGTYKSCKL